MFCKLVTFYPQRDQDVPGSWENAENAGALRMLSGRQNEEECRGGGVTLQLSLSTFTVTVDFIQLKGSPFSCHICPTHERIKSQPGGLLTTSMSLHPTWSGQLLPFGLPPWSAAVHKWCLAGGPGNWAALLCNLGQGIPNGFPSVCEHQTPDTSIFILYKLQCAVFGWKWKAFLWSSLL